MALYPAETRYPKTPWTTALLLMTLIALLSTRNVLVASGLSWLRLMAQKLGVSASSASRRDIFQWFAIYIDPVGDHAAGSSSGGDDGWSYLVQHFCCLPEPLQPRWRGKDS